MGATKNEFHFLDYFTSQMNITTFTMVHYHDFRCWSLLGYQPMQYQAVDVYSIASPLYCLVFIVDSIAMSLELPGVYCYMEPLI